MCRVTLQDKIRLYFEMLLQPAMKMAAMCPGSPAYCMPLTMLMSDMRAVCETDWLFRTALGIIRPGVTNSLRDGGDVYEVQTLYATGMRVGDHEGYGPYPTELEPLEINCINRFMKKMVKRYCDSANDYLPTLCQTHQLIETWRTYRCRYDKKQLAKGDQLTDHWKQIAKFVESKLWPNITPTPLDDADDKQVRALSEGFIDELKSLVDQIPDDIFREV